MYIKNLFIACLTLSSLAVGAQESDSYFVYTKNFKPKAQQTAESQKDEEKPDFISQHFRFYSLCDWQPGMKFMVMPEKYDLIVSTFCDAETRREVDNGTLRHKIMVYKGHQVVNGHSCVVFNCLDDQKDYYYQITTGSFESYCGGKMGVPTLAYLGDVDTARVQLVGRTLVTKLNSYYRDSNLSEDGREKVNTRKEQEVKVVAVGVGSRKYPVKLIVEDEKGEQFFMDVAISRTNSGMRDDEFGAADEVPHTFRGAFDLRDEFTSSNKDYARYLDKQVYTLYATKMKNQKGEDVRVVKLSRFKVTKIQASERENYVAFTLKSLKSGEVFTKEVTFANQDVIGAVDGNDESYVAELFSLGEPGKDISAAHRDLIQKGRIAKGFNRQEVLLAKGMPMKKIYRENGVEEWAYQNGTIVRFDKNGKVVK